MSSQAEEETMAFSVLRTLQGPPMQWHCLLKNIPVRSIWGSAESKVSSCWKPEWEAGLIWVSETVSTLNSVFKVYIKAPGDFAYVSPFSVST